MPYTGAIQAVDLGAQDLTTTGNISGTWTGDVIDEVHGGTNQSTYTIGDTLYASAANTLSKLSGNVTTTQKFLSQTGDGAASAAPVWGVPTGELSSQSTGLKTGGVLSIGTGGAGVATSFTIALGVGLIVDNTIIPATMSEISWSAKTDVAVTNIGTQPLTFVAIDPSGNVIQQATDFTDAQHRQYIVIGSVIHTNLTTVTAVNQAQHLAISPQSQLNDLMQAIAGFNYSGNLFSANGANLNINKSTGVLFKQGSNYATSANSPNSVTTGSLTAASFRYNNQTGAASAIVSAIDPNNYDNAGTTTAVPVNKFTTQRIFLFTSNLIAIQRGQTVYNSLSEAKAAIQNETFIVSNAISPNGILRAFLIVRQGATALDSATSAFFLEAPKFGGTAGVGGLSVSTLQNAYDNSSTPEILTDATRGAVTVRRGSAADTDYIYEGLNGAGTTTFGVTGNGVITGVGTGLTGAAASLTAGTATVANTVSTANEVTDTTCFPLFVTASGTQSLQPKNNASLTYNSSTGNLSAVTFTGAFDANGYNLSNVGDIVGTSGSLNLRTSTSFGSMVNLTAYDTNDSIYRLFATMTAGTTPSLAITAPSGGTITINGATIGGTTAAAGTFTGLNVTGLTASYAVVTDGSKNLASLQYTNANTVSTLVQRDASGNFSAGTITSALTGNASTATNVAASGITGTTLASNVVTSSLTSVGTVTSGIWHSTTQYAFSAIKSAQTNDVTGDGTAYTIICDTELFDQGLNYNNTTGIFTAPVTGRYYFTGAIYCRDLTASFNSAAIDIYTSNRVWRMDVCNIGAIRNVGNDYSQKASCFIDMDAADTAYMRTVVAGSTKTVDIYGAATDPHTFFGGYLVC